MGTKQVQPTEIDLELCINCPLHKGYVPIIGNCLELKKVGRFGYQVVGFDQYVSTEDEKLHPADEIVTLPSLNGSKDLVDVFKEEKKCEYFDGIRHGLRSRIIRSVKCSHPTQ